MPGADALYGCDGAWWRLNAGVPGFTGLKLTQDGPAAAAFSDLRKVELLRGKDRILCERPGVIGDGGNSGFQALNLAAQFGARLIAAVGFDMRLDRGAHWHGAHGYGLNNPSERNLVHWRLALHQAAADLAALGVRVVNASEESTLTAFPKMPLREALACLP